MLANRVFTSVVARSFRASLACRYASTTTTTAKPAAPAEKKLTRGAAELEYAKARANLPKRLYSKSGALASRLYVNAEKINKADVDKVSASLEALRNELVAHPKLNVFLSSPAKTIEQKLVLLKRLGATLKFHPTLAKFVEGLAQKRQTKELLKIARDYDVLIKSRDKIVTVKVTLASADQPKPKPETIQKALNYSTDTKINVTVVVDPSIEGGAILAGPDRYVDVSFKKELTALKEQLAKQQKETQQKKRIAFLEALSQFENPVSP